MGRNVFEEVNDRVFRELDRLEAAEGDDLAAEIERAKVVGSMCSTAISNANTVMRAYTMQTELGQKVSIPKMIAGGE